MAQYSEPVRLPRVIQIVVRDLIDDTPDNPHTLDGALRVIRWAAPDLTDDEAIRVRDEAVRRAEDVSTNGFARCIRAVLGPDVTILDADGRPLAP